MCSGFWRGQPCLNGYLTWHHTRVALKTSNCAALSHKNAHAAQSPGKWETWSTRARVPADDECLSAPWREECREREGGKRRRGREKWRWKREWMWGNRKPCETTSSGYSAFTKVSPGASSSFCYRERKESWPQMKVAAVFSAHNETVHLEPFSP